MIIATKRRMIILMRRKADRRRVFDLEIACGLSPLLDATDREFVRNIRNSPGGYMIDGTWQLPSGLTLSGYDIAALPAESING